VLPGSLLGGVLAAVLAPVLHAGRVALSGDSCAGIVATRCDPLVGSVEVAALVAPAILALLVAWTLQVILVKRRHQWRWLASSFGPLAVVFFITGPLLTGHHPTSVPVDVPDSLLILNLMLVALAVLSTVAYFLWFPPRRPNASHAMLPPAAPLPHSPRPSRSNRPIRVPGAR
jgi:hypothetical protein